MYQLVSGVNGTVVYDSHPCLLYRQHPQNEIGSNMGPLAKMQRAVAVLNGRYRRWNRGNLQLLSKEDIQLLPQHRQSVETFAAATTTRYFEALRLTRQSGVRRRRRSDTLSLYVAAFFGLI
jgi:hypothetical protein